MLTQTVHALAEVFPTSLVFMPLQNIKVLSCILSPRWMSTSVCSGLCHSHWIGIMGTKALEVGLIFDWPQSSECTKLDHLNLRALEPRNPNSRALTSQGSLGSLVVLGHLASYSACRETLLRTNRFVVFHCRVYNQSIRRWQGCCAIRFRMAAM